MYCETHKIRENADDIPVILSVFNVIKQKVLLTAWKLTCEIGLQYTEQFLYFMFDVYWMDKNIKNLILPIPKSQWI